MNQPSEERVGIYIDGANIFYGMEGERMNFAHFTEWLAEGRKITKACYFNALKPEKILESGSFLGHLKKAKIRTYIRKPTLIEATNQYKQEGVDVHLTVKAMKHKDSYDTFILVSGDYDYIPLIKELKAEQKNIEIVSFKNCIHPVYNNYKVRYMDDYKKEHAFKNYKKYTEEENKDGER